MKYLFFINAVLQSRAGTREKKNIISCASTKRGESNFGQRALKFLVVSTRYYGNIIYCCVGKHCMWDKARKRRGMLSSNGLEKKAEGHHDGD